jgi:hypothetical protein
MEELEDFFVEPEPESDAESDGDDGSKQGEAARGRSKKNSSEFVLSLFEPVLGSGDAPINPADRSDSAGPGTPKSYGSHLLGILDSSAPQEVQSI